MATPPIKRSSVSVSELARIPHSALCPAAAPSQVPELREPIPIASARECTCGAGLLRLMAGGAR